jgi:hypothetical protein
VYLNSVNRIFMEPFIDKKWCTDDTDIWLLSSVFRCIKWM